MDAQHRQDHGHGHGHGTQQDHRHIHGHTPLAAHGHQHSQAQAHAHDKPGAPSTEGRLIRWARLYDPFLWLRTAGQLRKLRAIPLALAAIKPGERVLDVGCGTGDLTFAAARKVGPGTTVYGVDAAPEMIAEARRKARRSGRSVQFLVEAVEAMSFDDSSFDLVLSSFVMHHLPGDLKRRALLEIRRVLRPGGRIVIMDFQPTAQSPSIWQPGGWVARIHRHDTPSPEAVRAGLSPLADMLREAGFTSVENASTRYPWMGYVLARVPA